MATQANLIKSFTLLTLPLLLWSCSTGTANDALIRFPYLWIDTPGYGGDIDKQGIVEPSGIVFHPGRQTLFVVSDEGRLYEITTQGDPIADYPIPGDLEGVTVDPQSGLLYVLVEGDDIILEVDPGTGEVARRFPINRSFGGNPEFLQKQKDSFDNGCEALAFAPDRNSPEGGFFFVSNQWDPPCVLRVSVPLRTASGKEAEARIDEVLPVRVDDPAAMHYDPATGILDVVSDADNILIEVLPSGRSGRVYAFPGDNQEGLTKDNQGYLYIAQDSGGILKVKDLRQY